MWLSASRQMHSRSGPAWRRLGTRAVCGLSRTEFTTVNMETLPPIPMLTERMAVRANPRAERSPRKALRKSSIHIATLQFGYPRVGVPLRNNPATRQFVLILSTETQSCGGMCSLLERMTAKTDSSSRPGLFTKRSHACRSRLRVNGRQTGGDTELWPIQALASLEGSP